MDQLMPVIGTTALLGSALVGGVFFAFSSFVMKALSRLPAAEGIAAMQSINVVVLNPSFLGAFMGTAILSLGAVGGELCPVVPSRLAWYVARPQPLGHLGHGDAERFQHGGTQAGLTRLMLSQPTASCGCRQAHWPAPNSRRFELRFRTGKRHR